MLSLLALLASLESLFLCITFEYCFQRAWIGLSHYVDNWRWSLSNTSLYKPGEMVFSPWNSGEPNSYMNEEYCSAMRSDGLWVDANCENSFKSICFDVTGENIKGMRNLKLM